jgi:hypothetical protein
MKAALALMALAALAVLAGAASAAPSATIYRYHDSRIRRDIFVSTLEQVPPQYRAQAQLVSGNAPLVQPTATPRPSAQTQAETGVQTHAPAGGTAGRQPANLKQAVQPGALEQAVQPGALEQAMRRALHEALGRDFSLRGLSEAMDTALVRAGKSPLSAAERAGLMRLAVVLLVFSALTVGFAVAMWIVLVMHAWRSERRWWTVPMFVNVVGIVYALMHVEKHRRLLRYSAVASQAAPILVAMLAAWQLRAWFVAVVVARAGM